MSNFSFAHLMGGQKAAPRAEEAPEEETAEEEAPEEEAAEEEAPEEEAAEEETPPADKAEARAYARGRAAERRRCAAILGSPAAAGNVAAACELAFHTSLTAQQVAGVLATLTPAKKAGGGLAKAMAAQPQPDVGSDGPAASAPSQTQAGNPLVSAYARQTGDRPRARQ